MSKKIGIKESMESLVSEYGTTFQLATLDLAGHDYRTRNSVEMAKNQANTRLPQLTEKYSEILGQSTVCFLVYGSDDEFTQFESQLGEVLKGGMSFSDSTLSLYEYFSPRVEANMTKDRQFDVHSLMMLVSEMSTLGKELGKNSILEPKLNTVKVTPDHNSVVMAIRDAIMINSNYSFMLEYVQHNFTKNALAAKHAAHSTVFVLRCLDEKEANDLATVKSVPVDLSSTSEYSKLIKDTLKNQKGAY